MKERNIALAIILTLITGGIYGVYWFIVLTDELNEAADPEEKTSGGMAFLLTLVTCGIYGIYWYYKMGKLLEMAYEKRGMGGKSYAATFLIFALLGLGIVSYALMQNGLNDLCNMPYARAYTPSAPAAAPVSPAPAYSEVKKSSINGTAGVYKGASFDIEDGTEVLFGRDDSCCNIIFPNTETAVSRKHCSVKYIGMSDSFYVTVYSQNGVLYDGENRIEAGNSKMLKKGTVIALGTTSNQFILG